MHTKTVKHSLVIETTWLSGRLDALEAGGLREILAVQLADDTCRLVVDLSEVSFVDSAGLAALVNAMKGARSRGGDLVLVSPTSAEALRVFKLTRFDEVFAMFATLDDALASW